MERFNLDTWLEDKSRKVIDDDGFTVEIIKWDANEKYPVVLLNHNGIAYNVSVDGMYDSDPNHGLFFADDEPYNPYKAAVESIAEMVTAFSDDIRMIVFNNCFSSTQAEMIVGKVEATIGMNKSIEDESAIIFSSQLYSAIGFGVSLEKAFGQAKARLMAEGTDEENTPQLYVKEGFEAKDIVFVK